MADESKKLQITMANVRAYNVANKLNSLGRQPKDETQARMNYLFSYMLDHHYWLEDCTIDKIYNHIQNSCDSC